MPVVFLTQTGHQMRRTERASRDIVSIISNALYLGLHESNVLSPHHLPSPNTMPFQIRLKKPYGSNFSFPLRNYHAQTPFLFSATTKVPNPLPIPTLSPLAQSTLTSATISFANTLRMDLSRRYGSPRQTWLQTSLRSPYYTLFSLVIVIA